MTTCTHPNRRNGYCTACLRRVPTRTDALLTGVWRAAVKRVRRKPVTTKRLLAVGYVRNGGEVQIKQ